MINRLDYIFIFKQFNFSHTKFFFSFLEPVGLIFVEVQKKRFHNKRNIEVTKTCFCVQTVELFSLINEKVLTYRKPDQFNFLFYEPAKFRLLKIEKKNPNPSKIENKERSEYFSCYKSCSTSVLPVTSIILKISLVKLF